VRGCRWAGLDRCRSGRREHGITVGVGLAESKHRHGRDRARPALRRVQIERLARYPEGNVLYESHRHAPSERTLRSQMSSIRATSARLTWSIDMIANRPTPRDA